MHGVDIISQLLFSFYYPYFYKMMGVSLFVDLITMVPTALPTSSFTGSGPFRLGLPPPEFRKRDPDRKVGRREQYRSSIKVPVEVSRVS